MGFFTKFFKKVGKFLGKIGKVLGAAAKWFTSEFGDIGAAFLALGAVVLSGGLAMFGVGTGAAAGAGATATATGAAATTTLAQATGTSVIKSVLVGAAKGAVKYGLTGGVIAKATGGKFADGFLAGATVVRSVVGTIVTSWRTLP